MINTKEKEEWHVKSWVLTVKEKEVWEAAVLLQHWERKL